ncbi:MAG: hypothetical protein KIC46_06315 [Clostridiales bacterium]|nr:hypothetical protein [Clostridiales bacterium]
MGDLLIIMMFILLCISFSLGVLAIHVWLSCRKRFYWGLLFPLLVTAVAISQFIAEEYNLYLAVGDVWRPSSILYGLWGHLTSRVGLIPLAFISFLLIVYFICRHRRKKAMQSTGNPQGHV